MSPRLRAVVGFALLLGVALFLALLFPAAFRFVQLAAQELRYLWWLVLLLALAFWLIWGLGRRPRK